MLTFIIPGTPRTTQPGSAVRLPNGRSFQPKRHPEWTAWCRLCATQHAPAEPLDGPIWVNLMYSMPKPKSAPKSRLYPWQRPDLCNFEKGMLDSFQGILFHDDAQICKMALAKRYCDPDEQPNVEVAMGELP